jgi:hypothetical protein
VGHSKAKDPTRLRVVLCATAGSSEDIANSAMTTVSFRLTLRPLGLDCFWRIFEALRKRNRTGRRSTGFPSGSVFTNVSDFLSVTEGEDKPLKYPTIFDSADVAILTKMDLAAVVEFDEGMAHQNIQAVRPGMKVFKVSAKSGEGMNEYLEFLARHRATRHSTSSAGNNRHSVSVR